MVVLGDPQGDSAMARSVGVPVAVAALKVLDGSVRAKGVQGPGVESALWKGVLEGTEEKGLRMVEGVVRREKLEGGKSVEDVLAEGV